MVYGVRIGTTQLCSKALIQIERSKRCKYNQAQFINYAMLCRATRICFTNHVQNHNTLQRLKVIFVKLTTAVTIEEKVNLQCKHATLVNNYRRSFMSVRQTVFVFVSFKFFFLSLSVLFFYLFYDNLLHSRDILRYPQALTSRSQDERPRKPTRT